MGSGCNSDCNNFFKEWTPDGDVKYTGPAITGTYQGQNYYNGSYFYTAVDDNLWIRLARV